jgi:hypothetical protein
MDRGRETNMAALISLFTRDLAANAEEKKRNRTIRKKKEINKDVRKKERNSSSISTVHSYFTTFAISLNDENSEPEELH